MGWFAEGHSGAAEGHSGAAEGHSGAAEGHSGAAEADWAKDAADRLVSWWKPVCERMTWGYVG
jgi:hypothetical protein